MKGLSIIPDMSCVVAHSLLMVSSIPRKAHPLMDIPKDCIIRWESSGRCHMVSELALRWLL